MRWLVGGTVLVVAMAYAAPGRAEAPLTPSHPNPPSHARSFVEPPAATEAKPAAPSPPTTEAAAPQQQTMPAAPQRSRRRYSHRSVSRDHMARLLNRRELSGGYYGYGAGMPYYGGWGPNPYSPSGP